MYQECRRKCIFLDDRFTKFYQLQSMIENYENWILLNMSNVPFKLKHLFEVPHRIRKRSLHIHRKIHLERS